MRPSLLGLLALAPVCAGAQAADTGDAGAAGAHRVEILTGSDPACATLSQELTGHWASHGLDEEPQWRDPDFMAPRELGDAEEADLDFYNDGKLSRVLINYNQGDYLSGSSLLVQHGRAADKLDLAVEAPLEDPDTWLIPCQLQGKRFPLRECPPFSHVNDDAGLTVSWANGSRHVHFLGRHADIALLRLNGTTFLLVTGSTPEAQGYAVVLKPLPVRTFSTTCVLQRR